MCRYFNYTRAAYYKSIKVGEKTLISESLIMDLVQQERRHQPRLGGKKLYFMLHSAIHGIDRHFGRDKFFNFLRNHDLLVERKRQYSRTTNSWHHFHKYGNKIKDLTLSRPNQVWASDITYVRTEKGFAYLSLITDMYSRKIVGWSLSENLSIEGSLSALKTALKTNPLGGRSLVHHSDRGVQYCSYEYVNILKNNAIEISMTEVNHCYENALAERVNGILKDEYLLDSVFKDFTHAQQCCKQAVMLYNTRRPHWALEFRTPEQVHRVA
jgi:transposase InsO family protein